MMWSDSNEAMALLKQCADDPDISTGQAANKLSRELGTPVTRNAVISKANRSGFSWEMPNGNRVSREKSPSSSLDVPRLPTRQHREPKWNAVTKTRGTEVKPVKPATESDSFVPLPENRVYSVEHLGKKVCRWPYGDPLEPGFYFCGTPTGADNDKEPYCEHHKKQAKGKTVR